MAAKTNWAVNEEVTAAKLNTLGAEVNNRLEAIPTNVALRIVETSTGVWSGDVPARANGENPLEAIGWSDPLGANGVATPANWQEEHDTWTVKTAP